METACICSVTPIRLTRCTWNLVHLLLGLRGRIVLFLSSTNSHFLPNHLLHWLYSWKLTSLLSYLLSAFIPYSIEPFPGSDWSSIFHKFLDKLLRSILVSAFLLAWLTSAAYWIPAVSWFLLAVSAHFRRNYSLDWPQTLWVHSLQCRRKTFMVHQTFVWWTLYQTFGPSHRKYLTCPTFFAYTVVVTLHGIINFRS